MKGLEGRNVLRGGRDFSYSRKVKEMLTKVENRRALLMIDSKFQRAQMKRFRTWEWVRNRVRKRRVRAMWGLE